ncbi:MAG: LD-carboxypeptidase [Chlorobi bacterium]|nr:LD-carboxypeptidase [Chlorobiota bacterium]
MIFPRFIKEGAAIGIVAPAGKVDKETIEYSREFLHQLGYKVVFGENVLNVHNQFAGSDALRSADFQHMLNSADVDVIMCARGGYGTNRIINELDFSHYIQDPKWIVGYSDITVLHSMLQNRLGIASIHGQMPKNFTGKERDDSDIVNLFNILKGILPQYEIAANPLNRPGYAEGELIGGNLSILYSLRGTSLDFDPHGKILFVEDVGEKLYHLDRMMMNLKIGGVLKCLRGIVVGQFTEMTDSDTPFGSDAYEIIYDAVKDYNYPVLFDFPAGHVKVNQPLIFGKRVTLRVDGDGGRVNF